MQIDSTFTNAIHICAYLERSEKELVNSSELAKSIGTNPVVVRRIVGKLKELGIIKVKQGLHGGYYLGRPAASISLWDIYLAVKRENPFRCRIGNEGDTVSAALPVALEKTFAKAEYALKQPLAATSIKQVAGKV